MSTIQLNGRDFASQTASAEPVLASTVTGGGGLTQTTFARWRTNNGWGSTDTKIAKFTDEDVASNDTVVTVTNTAANGFKAVANMDCFIHMQWSTDSTGGVYIGITKNSTELTTNLLSQTSLAVVMMLNYCHAVHVNNEVSWSGELASGDILRPHASGFSAGGNTGRAYISVFATKKI